MKPRASKVMVIGWDGAPGERAIRFAKDGKLPALASLIERGVHAAHCLAPHPTITPPNWTTIATGAWPGTHGVTCFNVHQPGDRLLEVHQGFDAHDSRAEFLWDAASRSRKKSIILNWPMAYPSQPKEGVCIGGYGTSVNEWRYGVPEGLREYDADVAGAQLFTIGEYPEATTVELSRPEGWSNVPPVKDALQAELAFQYHNPRFAVKSPVTWHMLILDTTGEGYDQVIFSESRDVKKAFARLRPGEWTPKLTVRLETTEGARTAEFRVKLEAMSPDLTDLRVYVTALCNPDGWAYPGGTMGEIKSVSGLPLPDAGYTAAALGWISPETYLELAEMLHEWQADATHFLLKNKPWDLFLTHYHIPDWTYHVYGRLMERAFNDEDPDYYQEVELKAYQSVDRALARTLELADENTLVIVVSDHGCTATSYEFHPAKLLAEAGLTVFKEAVPGEPVRLVKPDFNVMGDQGKGVLDRTMAVVVEQGTGEVDWTRTKAVMQRSSYVYVNLKGRDPEGIVEPGKEYEQICDQVIRLLYDYTDPLTGKKPVVFALHREDARMIGLHGDQVGDVVFGTSAWFGRQHGVLVPTGSFGVLSMEALFVMAGPNIKQGHRMERTMRLVDVVPTVCHLAEVPIPRQCEGAVLYQALVNPDAQDEELKTLRQRR